METILMYAVKITTALAGLFLLGIGSYSLITGQHPMVVVISLIIGSLLSFLTYVDIKHHILDRGDS
jgi:hypothetical protein